MDRVHLGNDCVARIDIDVNSKAGLGSEVDPGCSSGKASYCTRRRTIVDVVDVIRI